MKNELYSEGGVSTHRALPNNEFMVIDKSPIKRYNVTQIPGIDGEASGRFDDKMNIHSVNTPRIEAFCEKFREKYGESYINL